MKNNKIIHIKPDQVGDSIWIEIIDRDKNNSILQYVFHEDEFKEIIKAGLEFLNKRGDRI